MMKNLFKMILNKDKEYIKTSHERNEVDSIDSVTTTPRLNNSMTTHDQNLILQSPYSNNISQFMKNSISKNSNQINVELLGEVLVVILGLNTVQN